MNKISVQKSPEDSIYANSLKEKQMKIKKWARAFFFLFLIGPCIGFYGWYNRLNRDDLTLEQGRPFLKIMYTRIDAFGDRNSLATPEINSQYVVSVRFPLLFDAVEYIIDTGASLTTIPLSLYKKGIANNKPTGKRVEIVGVGGNAGTGEIILLEYIEIGNIKLNNVEAVICEKCPALLGQNVLKRLNLRTENRDGKSFLIISN